MKKTLINFVWLLLVFWWLFNITHASDKQPAGYNSTPVSYCLDLRAENVRKKDPNGYCIYIWNKSFMENTYKEHMLPLISYGSINMSSFKKALPESYKLYSFIKDTMSKRWSNFYITTIVDKKRPNLYKSSDTFVLYDNEILEIIDSSLKEQKNDNFKSSFKTYLNKNIINNLSKYNDLVLKTPYRELSKKEQQEYDNVVSNFSSNIIKQISNVYANTTSLWKKYEQLKSKAKTEIDKYSKTKNVNKDYINFVNKITLEKTN